MKIERKFLKSDLKDVLETLIFDAEEFGHNFIELRHLTQCETQDVIMGVEEARIVSRRKPGSRVAVAQGVKIINDGVLTFYPDVRYRRWAYLLDTPKNRRWLAAQLISPLVDVVDPNRVCTTIATIASIDLYTVTKEDLDFDSGFNIANVLDKLLFVPA